MRTHRERHKLDNVSWLRAAVLGANDGIVSTTSLIVGVAAAQGTHNSIMIAGIAGLASGAMSMAAGEYVSVSSQADNEKAALEQEKTELKSDPHGELKELTNIYIKRGLNKELAAQVAEQLTAKDALGAHARDELGISDSFSARPVQAAIASAASFAIGASLPLLTVLLAPYDTVIPIAAIGSLLSLAILGAVSAKLSGANIPRSVARVTFWSALAMLVTYGIGRAFGTVSL